MNNIGSSFNRPEFESDNLNMGQLFFVVNLEYNNYLLYFKKTAFFCCNLKIQYFFIVIDGWPFYFVLLFAVIRI